MKFLGTQDIALRAEKQALEENIQKAGMSGADKRDPNAIAKMRGRLAEIYNHLDPARATREQIKANQMARFNPAFGDYDPLSMSLQTAMTLVDRKYGSQPGYIQARDQVKYSIQNQLSGGTPIDSASVVGRARDELTRSLRKDPGGPKAASLESRRNLVDAQKIKASDLEGMTNPFDVAMTLIGLQNQGGMDRPIGGGRANRPSISPYGETLPAQAMAAVGMVTDQMRPSESIPSAQGILGKEKGTQVDAFVRSFGSMFDPANLATPISGAADMADMAFRSLDPTARKQVEKELKGATKEEQETFLARMLGMLAGGAVQGKLASLAGGKLRAISDRKLPANLEATLESIKPSAAQPQRNSLPEMKITQAAPDQIGLAQAASMKRPAKPRVELVAAPADFTVGQEVKVPKKSGSEVAAKVTDVTDYSVGIETANGVKKFYSPEDAKAILKNEAPAIQAKATPMATQLAPEDILVHPDIQFRGKAKSSEMVIDKTGNVTTKLKSVDAYNKTQGGSLLVWESNNGKRFVVDGHHRLELAKRAARFVDDTPEGQIDVPREIPVNIIRETDGWSLNEAQFKGLMANLRDQKADPLDAALILRKRGITPDQIDGFFTKEGVTVSAARSKEIKGTMGLSDPAFEKAMASYDVNQQSVAGVGSVDGLTPEQQLAAIGILEKGDHNTFKEGAVIAQKLKDRGAGTVTKAADDQMGFGDMFGDGGPDPFADYLSTIGTEATLQKMAEGQITKKFRDLNAPLNADLLEGEFINADLRGALKDKLGGSQSKAKGKVDMLFDLDKNFQRYVSEQAQKVMNGDVSEDQAAKEIAQAAIDKIGSPDFEREFVRGLVQPGADSGSNGGLPPGPPDTGGVPGSPDPGKTGGVKSQKNRRQAGRTDLKTVAGVATVAAGAAGLYFKDEIEEAIATNNLQDIRNTVLKAGLATAFATIVFEGGRNFGKSVAKSSNDPFRFVLDPRSLEKLAEPGPFKSSLLDVLSTNDLYRLKTTRAMLNVEDAAKKSFGKNPGKNPVYQEWNKRYRDHVEMNLATGKNWDDGIPEPFADFAKTAIKEMDKMLDEWEDLGGRISVKNDGSQHLKMEDGASIKLVNGGWAEYVGYEKTPEGIVIKAKVKDPSLFPDVNPEDLIYKIPPKQSFQRPVYRMGEAYVPRIYTRAFIDQLINGDDAFKAALSDAVVKAGGEPLTDTEFVTLKDMARGFNETEAATDINSFMGNLQKERQLQFAKFEYTTPDGEIITVDPYENSYFDAVRKYMDRAAKRVAIAEVMGIESDVLAKTIDGIRSVDYKGAEYLNTLVGRLLDLGPEARDYKGLMEGVARTEGQYQTITKLFGGTSAISQFSDVIIPLTETGGVNVAKSIGKLIKDKDFRSDIDAFNGGTQAWIKEMTDIEHTGNKAAIGAAKFIDFTMGVLQVKRMDQLVKRINTASVVTEAERLMKKVESGAKLSEPEARAMDRIGLTKWQEQIKSTGTDALMNDPKFQADLAGHARTFQYSGAPEDLPLWMSSPAGAMVMRFKKPWYVTTKTLMQGAMNEATKGNFTPIARLVAYSVAIGGGAQYMKDIIKLAGLDEETRQLFKDGDYLEAVKRMFVDVPAEKNYLGQAVRAIREDKAAGLMQMFGLFGQTIYESGSGGVAGEFFPLNTRNQSDIRRFNFWERLEPISMQSARRLAGIPGDLLRDGVTEKTSANAYETIRSENIPARRVFDLLNFAGPVVGLPPFKPDEVVRRENERKIKAENAKIPKNMPDKYRNKVLEGVAVPEKIKRKIAGSIKSGKAPRF